MTQDVATITDKNCEEEVVKAKGPVLIDFWAEWCGPCRMVGPLVEELAKEYKGKLKVGKLNVDDNPASPTTYGVMNIPTLIFFSKGKEVERVVGALPKGALVKKINEALGE